MTNKEFTIKEGETVDLGEGVQLKFVAHSHYRTMTGGPPSPLVIHVEYFQNGKLAEKTHYHFTIEDYQTKAGASGTKNTGWKWRKYIFELIDYEANNFMKLKVTADPESKQADGLLPN